MKTITLEIKDCPDVESVKTEIVANAMTTISNYLRGQVPQSAEEIAVEATIEAVKESNPLWAKVATVDVGIIKEPAFEPTKEG